MFYSEAILSRRGPLAKVWLAAHMERKLSKTQTLQTDIEQSVDAIMGQEIEVMALRLSGQLLLGVVRIYSRKAKYLLDDCNEALLKIKMAFRPGVVDMTEDQLTVNKSAITLQTDAMDLGMFIPDLNWDAELNDRLRPSQTQHQANIDDITLRAAEDFAQYDLDDSFDLGPSDGIGTNDFDVDLGLDWGGDNRGVGDNSMDVDASIEIGRDADMERESIASQLLGGRGDLDADILSREPSEHDFGQNMDIDIPDFSGMDLGDLGIGFGDQPEGEKTPSQMRASTRASSPLSSVPPTPTPEPVQEPEAGAETTPKPKRKHKEKKQVIDSVIEMRDGPGLKAGRGRQVEVPQRDVSDIVKEQEFLPESDAEMRLLQIRKDPFAHFMPTQTTEDGTFLCLAPPGLSPQLAELFRKPIESTGKRPRAASPSKASKKRRVDEGGAGDEEEPEQARREQSRAPSVGLHSDLGGDAAALNFGGQTAGFEDFQMDIPDMPYDDRAPSMPPTERSRMSTPAAEGVFDEEETYADASCPIATFDTRPVTQTQESDVIDTDGKGYSKNTIKALSIIRRDLQPSAEEEEMILSFNKMAEKASRRAASSFFFEILFLATRDCIHVSQTVPFANIEVRAKNKLWEKYRHGSVAPARPESLAPSQPSSRAASVARSVGSALGL